MLVTTKKKENPKCLSLTTYTGIYFDGTSNIQTERRSKVVNKLPIIFNFILQLFLWLLLFNNIYYYCYVVLMD